MSNQLSPHHVLWNQYNVERQDNDRVSGSASPRLNPVQHKDTFARLQKMGRTTARAQSMAHNVVTPRNAMMASDTVCSWQPVIKRDDEHEGLGLSEL